ncbi:MAG: hemolysin III family protein [Actinomycetota bacterium]|nr:hemolysin III family protein [Actinomycetota bacterium]
MQPRAGETEEGAPVKPLLRGVLHQIGFVAALPLAVLLGVRAEEGTPRIAAVAFSTSVAAMLGASALYHRPTWTPARRRWLRRLDHAGIYFLIAGTYTPVALLVLDGAWRVTVLAVVWTGAVISVGLRLVWISAPKWLSVVSGVLLGWVGVVVFPQLFAKLGAGPSLLLLAGGVCYTLGALVYACRRPNPLPAVFGYHEIFHALVIAAVALQYVAIAFFVLPRG